MLETSRSQKHVLLHAWHAQQVKVNSLLIKRRERGVLPNPRSLTRRRPSQLNRSIRPQGVLSREDYPRAPDCTLD